jgi:SpoVK/Ycf46/Vps4 family AAA+-type ATPase
MNVSNQETVANIPKVFWEDIGGLEEVRKEVLRTVSLPIKFPFLRKSGLKRSGLLSNVEKTVAFIIFLRHSSLWASWDRKNTGRQSCCN